MTANSLRKTHTAHYLFFLREARRGGSDVGEKRAETEMQERMMGKKGTKKERKLAITQ